MINFWIDECVAHFQIPISGNHSTFLNKRSKPISGFEKLWGCKKKNVEVQEKEANNASRII